MVEKTVNRYNLWDEPSIFKIFRKWWNLEQLELFKVILR